MLPSFPSSEPASTGPLPRVPHPDGPPGDRLLLASRAALEAKIAAQARRLRALSRDLATAEQRERSALSDLLHDHLQPLVHGAKMWAEILRENGPEAAPEALDRIVDLLDRALTTTRTLVGQLTPPLLEKAGFGAAVEWLADHLHDTHGLRVEVHVPADLIIEDEGARTLCFQAARELLFNVAKHAGVDRARLNVRGQGRVLHLEVADAGRGVDLDGSGLPKGATGLRVLRERLRWAGGTLSVAPGAPASGRGTRVQVALPLEAEPPRTDEAGNGRRDGPA
jgi:signal transduction histidine kinase